MGPSGTDQGIPKQLSPHTYSAASDLSTTKLAWSAKGQLVYLLSSHRLSGSNCGDWICKGGGNDGSQAWRMQASKPVEACR